MAVFQIEFRPVFRSQNECAINDKSLTAEVGKMSLESLKFITFKNLASDWLIAVYYESTKHARGRT